MSEVDLKDHLVGLLDALALRHDAAIKSLEQQLDRRINASGEIAEERWAGARREAERALQSAETAQAKFERTVEQRFAQVNEFRSALDDLGKQMATRRELESEVQGLERVDASQSVQLGDLRSRIDVGPDGLQSLRARADLREGHRAGVQATTSTIITIVSVAVGVIGLMLVIASLVLHSGKKKSAPPPSAIAALVEARVTL